jgi:hypothetical protein
VVVVVVVGQHSLRFVADPAVPTVLTTGYARLTQSYTGVKLGSTDIYNVLPQGTYSNTTNSESEPINSNVVQGQIVVVVVVVLLVDVVVVVLVELVDVEVVVVVKLQIASSSFWITVVRSSHVLIPVQERLGPTYVMSPETLSF